MFQQRLRRVLFFFVFVYAALFLLCLLNEYLRASPQAMRTVGDAISSTGPVSKKNYASERYTIESPAARGQVDQKYERTATVQSGTKAFEEDEKKARAIIAGHTGIIQYESGRGTRGRRVLYLHVGIQPARFDSFYADIQAIGTVQSMEITKTDKTNEFLSLKAKRASLEKNRAALMELKKRDGRIDELMALEQKILSIEQELQGLGVQLGEFDEVNAFCTARFTLVEYKEAVRARSILSYCKSAFYNATFLYMAGMGVLFFMALSAVLLLAAVDKFNLMRQLTDTEEKAAK